MTNHFEIHHIEIHHFEIHHLLRIQICPAVKLNFREASSQTICAIKPLGFYHANEIALIAEAKFIKRLSWCSLISLHSVASVSQEY